MNNKTTLHKQQDHPLHGLGLKVLLTELVDHYGWEILAEQININCFRVNPSIKSSHQFLHKTGWAREKLEAFYLYRYKQFPVPDDVQHGYAPRNRSIELTPLSDTPAVIELGDPEFFDDPVSGPVFPSKKSVQATRTNTPSSTQQTTNKTSKGNVNSPERASSNGDPWAKWR